MNIRILTGASGYGKTYELYGSIIDEAVRNPQNKYVLIVPEQSSLQAQKDIVRRHPKGGTFNIDVLTFGRLAYRIFEELGTDIKETIDDTGKNLIVRKVINSVSDSLCVVKNSKRQGFISQVKSMISEFKQYGISPKELKEFGDSFPQKSRFGDKLNDIYTIYEEFEEYIEGRYSTVESLPETLLAEMEKSSFLDDAVIAFDGFTGFTPVQYRIIEKMTECAKEIIMTATIPDNEKYNVEISEEDLFGMSKTMIRKMGEMADRHNIKLSVEPLCVQEENSRFSKAPALGFLEKHIFRYDNETFDGQQNEITVCEMPNPSEEVRYTAARILDMVRTGEVRFRDMAVVIGDCSTYSDDITSCFLESGIPFFMDNKRSVLGNPMVEYIRALFEIITSDFSYESVFRFLKNGLCEIDRDGIDILENYVLAYGIRGKNFWNKEFCAPYPGKKKELEIVNKTREQFLKLVMDFRERISKAKVTSEIVRIVYEFMENNELYERMEAKADEIENDGQCTMFMKARADQYRRIYSNVLKLLEQIDSLMGEDEITVKEFTEIMDAGFEEIKVGLIPPSIDCVTVGDIERTRLEHVKVMFILGVNEGLIPKLSTNQGILSENERKLFNSGNLELSPLPREKVFIQNFYLYLNMTEPERGLYAMYHRFDAEGKEAKPSRIIGMLLKMYPKMSVQTLENLDFCERITNADNSLHLLSYRKGEEITVPFKELVRYFMNDDKYSDIIRHMTESFSLSDTQKLSQEAAKLLYAQMDNESVSRMEKFASCPFSYFAQYGLELEERALHEISSLDLGVVFHGIMEQVFTRLNKNGKKITDINDDERDKLVSEVCEQVLNFYKDDFFGDSASRNYYKKRIEKLMKRTVWALSKQLERGKFTACEFEREFELNVNNTKIVGKIDRIDRYEDDNNVYVKVIDYKSNKKTISLDEIYAGLKLQLMVYLKAAIDDTAKLTDKNVIPAGSFYNSVGDPIVKAGISDTIEQCEKKRLREFRTSGLVSLESVTYLDEWSSGLSDVIPAKLTKEKMIEMGKDVCTAEQLKLVYEYSVEKINELDKDIKNGTIKADPYADSCKYCSYKGICGFDSTKTSFRKLETADEEDLWSRFKIGKEDENNGLDN